MKRLSCSLLMTIVLAGSTLVRGADEANPPATTSWYPLVVGNTWTYRVGENRFSLKVAKMEPVDKDKKNSPQQARIELIVRDKTVSFENIGISGGAVVRYSWEGKAANPPIPFLKLPPKKDAKWTVESKIEGQLLKGTFVETEEEVKVPAGTFKTIAVTGKDLEVNGVRISLTYYFADKIGMVKQVIEYAGHKAVVELEKFEPAKS